MSGRAVFTGRVFAELEKGLTIYARYKIWLFSDLISWPFWTIFFFLSFLMYAPSLLSSQYHLNAFTWSFFTFILVSSFMWASNFLATSAQAGILEYVIITGCSIREHMLGRSIVSFIDLAVGGPLLLLISAAGFGTRLFVAYPHLMFVALVLASAFFYFFSSMLAVLLVSLRSPWIIINVAQFIIPFTSGAIPVEVLPAELRSIITYSPFFYIIHPIVASATGQYFLPPGLVLTVGGILCLATYLASRVLEDVLLRRALRHGKFTIF
ncbi:hypothetical protein HRbin02_00341 [Candidatus Calditenuaceae archaeon HR02]|nr:hypothetical protein HRbin02_00341 [Candidatus Calditenuaceae archaeon HR02]